MDDGLDKNSQVCSSFSRFVPLQAHPKTSRTRIIQGDFEGELLTCFQGERIAVGFSFLLGSVHEKEEREKSRLIVTHSAGQTQMHLARQEDCSSERCDLVPGRLRLVSLCEGLTPSPWLTEEFWGMIFGDGQQRGSFGEAVTPFETSHVCRNSAEYSQSLKRLDVRLRESSLPEKTSEVVWW